MVKANPADIQILGIGENGHIAFNEPYTKPEDPTHISLLTASTRAANAGAFKDPSLVPQYALTMGIGEILTAKRILLLAMGERKARWCWTKRRRACSRSTSGRRRQPQERWRRRTKPQKKSWWKRTPHPPRAEPASENNN